MWKCNAARSPMSFASRRLTVPKRGARANTTTIFLTDKFAQCGWVGRQGAKVPGTEDFDTTAGTTRRAAI
jgi:hypothetical protein